MSMLIKHTWDESQGEGESDTNRVCMHEYLYRVYIGKHLQARFVVGDALQRDRQAESRLLGEDPSVEHQA